MCLRRLLAVAALMSACSCAAAAEPPFEQAVATAVFETCLDVVGGKLRLDDEAAMKRLGYSRAPATVESASANPKLGIPVVVSKGEGDRRIVLLTFRNSNGCEVSFGGPRAGTTTASLKARAARDYAGLRPDPAQSGTIGVMRAESYKFEIAKDKVFRMMFHSPSNAQSGMASGAFIGFTKD